MDAVAINRTRAEAMLDDGSVIKFDKMFDEFGDETGDCRKAVMATAPLPNGMWACIDLTKFETPSLN